jgi:hypothetical protein
MHAATRCPSAFAAIGLWEPPLSWVAWWPERTKACNAGVAASYEPADDIEAMCRWLLGDQVWDDLPPEVQAQRRAEGAAFQIDMASELDAPFDFQDVFVPALVGYGTATSAEHSEGARWLADSSRTPGCMRVPGPVTSPPAPTPGSSQPSRASSPNWPRNTRRIPATRQVRHENRDVIAPGPGAA